MSRHYFDLEDETRVLAVGQYVLDRRPVAQGVDDELLVAITDTQRTDGERSNVRFITSGDYIEIAQGVGVRFFLGAKGRWRVAVDAPANVPVRLVHPANRPEE